jgi:hypothetical protein
MFKEFVTTWIVRAHFDNKSVLLTLRYKSMRSHERRVFRVIMVDAINKIFEQEKIPRAPLHNCQKPVPKLEFPAARACFLSSHERCKIRVLGQESIIG